jgi:hypothetical protein
MPVTFARAQDDCVAGFEILRGHILGLNAYAALDDKEPLWPGVFVPVRSGTIREAHAIHADGNTGRVMSQPLDGRAANEGFWVDRPDPSVTRSKDAHLTILGGRDAPQASRQHAASASDGGIARPDTIGDHTRTRPKNHQ